MPLNRLTDYLDEEGVKYVVIQHSQAYTAQEVAASAHIPGKEMAKPVMLKVDGDLKMLVLPSTHNVVFEKVKEELDAEEVELASEEEFEELFPDCELGAMPPFGNLYDMDSIVDKVLEEDQEIAFNAGTHRELIRMAYEDFKKLAKPQVIEASVKQYA